MKAFQINKSFDLLSLASQDSSLRKQGSYQVGPCPFCGGKDRFVLKITQNGYRWYCRKCGDGKYRTSIDYIVRREKINYSAALKRFDTNDNIDIKWCPFIKPKPLSLDIPDPEWQMTALRQVDEASDRLLSGNNSEGRDYLGLRGIHRGIWHAWHLGFSYVFDPAARVKRSAIVLPWIDFDSSSEVVTAVKYRFIKDHPVGLRYMSRRGSVPILFGLWDALPEHRILLLIEGEFNALSAWQCLPASVSCLSFGSEAATNRDIIKVIAMRYQSVFIWEDNPKKARELKSFIGFHAKPIQSPVIEGEKWDANKMLQKRYLASFISSMIGVECLGRV